MYTELYESNTHTHILTQPFPVHRPFTGCTLESLNTLLPCYHIHTPNTIAQSHQSRRPRHEDKRADSFPSQSHAPTATEHGASTRSSYKPAKFNPSTSERASGCTAGANEDEEDEVSNFCNLWLPRDDKKEVKKNKNKNRESILFPGCGFRRRYTVAGFRSCLDSCSGNGRRFASSRILEMQDSGVCCHVAVYSSD